VVGCTLKAREEILARIRAALVDVPDVEVPDEVPVPRDYRSSEKHASSVELFVERVTDYGAAVHRVEPGGIAEAVGAICSAHGAGAVAVPTDLPHGWIPRHVEAISDAGLDVRELDRIGAAVTACTLGIAETGTIAFDGGTGQGRRALTLVPDLHVCVVLEDQIVDGVPAAMRRLAAGLRLDGRPVTLVSGPSATSDIEFSRVEGVHGPRRLELVLVSS
jgi:L-lactate dehydrogenase complex protein LldG